MPPLVPATVPAVPAVVGEDELAVVVQEEPEEPTLAVVPVAVAVLPGSDEVAIGQISEVKEWEQRAELDSEEPPLILFDSDFRIRAVDL